MAIGILIANFVHNNIYTLGFDDKRQY